MKTTAVNSNQKRPHIMVAPNGARRNKADHIELPMTLDEILAETVACQKAGADALHLHVRDSEGNHSLDPGCYRETLDALASVLPNFPVQITTESAGIFEVSQQIETVRHVQPDAVSISVREIAREPEIAYQMYGLCNEYGTHVQHILYDKTDWKQFQDWQSSGIISENQNDVIFVLGRYKPQQDAIPEDLEDIAKLYSEVSGKWMVCAFGSREQEVLLSAAVLGGNLRIGFENNVHNPKGMMAKNNADNVASLVAALDALAYQGAE